MSRQIGAGPRATGRGAAPGADAQDEREERARLAHVRQELLAPVSAIAGYADILREEAHRFGLERLIPDLERILSAAEILLELVEGLLEVDATKHQQTGDHTAVVQERLRHDLRNPLNAIKGYGEMLLEDIADLGGGALESDLAKLLDESSRLLASLDVIVDFSSRGTKHAGARADSTSAMVAGILQTIQLLESDGARSRETGRILVVDDNASNRDLLVRRLTREGHGVTEAASGRTALRILEAEEVDLVLLDLMMPEMNGLQVLERLKADERLREIPVIMISGLQETDGVIRCIEAGAEDYLPKPFNPVLLRARIEACLERKRWHDRERHYLARLEEEKLRSEALLRNILPSQIIGRLYGGEVVIADRIESVTILFCDLVEFTELASRTAPAQLVSNLNRVFSTFDALSRDLGIEKIKTIGDAYMAAAGLPEPRPDHAEVVAELALGMLEALDRLNETSEVPFRVRIGMHTGPVVAGVIGMHKFTYDVWGDTVNVASRLEAHSVPGCIHVSEQTRRVLEHRYEFEPRGDITLRGKGQMRTAFLIARKGGARRVPPG
jgi:class 3 adenylate cyclase